MTVIFPTTQNIFDSSINTDISARQERFANINVNLDIAQINFPLSNSQLIITQEEVGRVKTLVESFILYRAMKCIIDRRFDALVKIITGGGSSSKLFDIKEMTNLHKSLSIILNPQKNLDKNIDKMKNVLTNQKNFNSLIELLTIKYEFISGERGRLIINQMLNKFIQNLEDSSINTIDKYEQYYDIKSNIEKLPEQIQEKLKSYLPIILSSKDAFNSCLSGIFSTIFEQAELSPIPLIELIKQKQQANFEIQDLLINNWLEFYLNNCELYEKTIDLIKLVLNNEKIDDKQLEQVDTAITQANTVILIKYYPQIIENGYGVLLEDLQNIRILPEQLKKLILANIEVKQEEITDESINHIEGNFAELDLTQDPAEQDASLAGDIG